MRATRFSKILIKPMRGDANALANVPLTIQGVAGQTGDLIQVLDSTGAVISRIGGSASGFGLGMGLQMARAKYDFAVDGGASCTPAINATIPDNAVIVGATINSTTAVTASGAATVGVGTTAGSTSTSLLAATGKATLSLDAIVAGVPTMAAPVKMTAAGSISILIATGPLLTGVIEVTIYYYQAAA